MGDWNLATITPTSALFSVVFIAPYLVSWFATLPSEPYFVSRLPTSTIYIADYGENITETLSVVNLYFWISGTPHVSPHLPMVSNPISDPSRYLS